MRENKPQNYSQDYRFQLECVLCGYSRYLMEKRLKEEGIPITTETLDSVGEIYSEKLIPTIETCMSNLIETDISNLKDIFDKIRRKDKEKGRGSNLDTLPM